MTNKLILIIGGTGQQGSAAARHLLQDGWQLRALVRDPNKAAAQALAAAGVELVQGDLNDRASVDAALEGVYGVFSVQNYWLPDVGYEGEIHQGTLLADAAKAADVQHFVYSSVGAAHRGMGQKHFASKWIIEQHIHEIGLPYTILRPVAFMENFNWSKPQISNGVFTSWGITKEQQLVAVDDIGAFTALAFAHPEEFLGQTIELAGDELDDEEKVAVFSKVIGRPVTVQWPQLPEGYTPDEEQVAMLNFFNGEAYTADIPALRQRYPKLHTFEQYLRANGWENLPVLPLPENAGGWG